MRKEDFIKLSIERYGDNFTYNDLKMEFKIRDYVDFSCKKHGLIHMIARDHLRSESGCRKCANEKSRKSINVIVKEFIIKSKIKFKNKFVYYPEDNISINIRCPKHGIFKYNIKRHLHSVCGCPKCGRESTYESNIKFKDINEFEEKCNEIHNNEYEYNIKNFRSLDDDIDIHCKKHGWFSLKARNHYLFKSKCKKCNIEKQTTSYDDFCLKCITIHGDNYLYHKDTYINTNNDIKITHKKCNKTFVRKAKKHLEGQRCPHCKYSKGEEKVIEFLIKNKIEYIREYKFYNDMKRFDFYLPKLNILIEYDGEQHFKPIDSWGGVKRFKYQVLNDKYKTNLSKKLNIPLIRISYKEYDNMEFMLKHKILKLRQNSCENKYLDDTIKKLLLQK